MRSGTRTRHHDPRWICSSAPRRPRTRCVPLLFESAKPYYTAYAGSEKRALTLLEAVFGEPGHAASYECCRVALADGELVGVVAGFPVAHGDRLSRRFVQLTLPAPAAVALAGHVPAPARGRRRLPQPAGRRLLRRRARGRAPTGAAEASPSGCSTTPRREAARAGLRSARARHRPAEPARPRALRGLRVRRARDPPRAATTARRARSAGPGFVGYLKAV